MRFETFAPSKEIVAMMSAVPPKANSESPKPAAPPSIGVSTSGSPKLEPPSTFEPD